MAQNRNLAVLIIATALRCSKLKTEKAPALSCGCNRLQWQESPHYVNALASAVPLSDEKDNRHWNIYWGKRGEGRREPDFCGSGGGWCDTPNPPSSPLRILHLPLLLLLPPFLSPSKLVPFLRTCWWNGRNKQTPSAEERIQGVIVSTI